MSADVPRSIPACERCGAERVFECQVVPTLIYLLLGKQGGEGVELEFGCVAVYVCSGSCGPREGHSASLEYVHVQHILQ